MFRSLLAGQRLCPGRRGIARAAYAAAAAGIALTTAGLTGTGAAGAAMAPQTTGAPVYTTKWAGYQAAGGRWFRFVFTTLTVPSADNGAESTMADIALNGRDPNWAADITVMPGGGPGSVLYMDPLTGFFNLSPDVGDQLAISIFYDQHGHDYYTATDITQGTSQRVRADVSSPSTPPPGSAGCGSASWIRRRTTSGSGISPAAGSPPTRGARDHPRAVDNQQAHRHRLWDCLRRGADEPVQPAKRRPELRRLAAPPVTTRDSRQTSLGIRKVGREDPPGVLAALSRAGRMQAQLALPVGKLWHVFGTEGRQEPSTAGVGRTPECGTGFPASRGQ
jgi:hypothetical protein